MGYPIEIKDPVRIVLLIKNLDSDSSINLSTEALLDMTKMHNIEIVIKRLTNKNNKTDQ